MTDTKDKINNKWLTQVTGDPFADTGGKVIETLFREKGHTDIHKLIKEVTDIYVNDWNPSKLGVFFLNSKITQNLFTHDKKISETITYFKKLIDDDLPFKEGSCRILGVKTSLFTIGRHNSILVGSGKFINFHHAFQSGLLLSKEAIIRMFFVPLGSIQLLGRPTILQSNDDEINTYFVETNIHETYRKLATRSSQGINSWSHQSASSALFDFAQKWLLEVKDFSVMENVELNLYLFTNFAASPEIKLYNFSSSLFKFITRINHRNYIADWKSFINSHFKKKSSVYSFDSDSFTVKEKKEIEKFEYQDFKNWSNPIYFSLLNNKSILKAILNRVKKGRSFSFEIVKLYQIQLRDMNQKTLTVIERIADFVLQDENNLKKKVFSLRKPEKAFLFRKALRKLEEENLDKQNSDTLFSLEEYALELFPDGTYWQEIQDLLLIAIYQKMHEKKIWFDEPIKEGQETNS